MRMRNLGDHEVLVQDNKIEWNSEEIIGYELW